MYLLYRTFAIYRWPLAIIEKFLVGLITGEVLMTPPSGLIHLTLVKLMKYEQVRINVSPVGTLFISDGSMVISLDPRIAK